MSAFTFSAAVGIIVLCICIAVRAVRIVFMILKMLFALLSKILKIFRKSAYHASQGSKCGGSRRFKDALPAEIWGKSEDDLCRKLRKIEKDGRILKNLYIPTSNGNTTGIDAVMLTKHGVYAFEYDIYHCNMLIRENVEDNWLRCAGNGHYECEA